MAMVHSNERELKPSLSLFDATAISVGAIIGAGIFVVTGIAARFAGPALVLSMILAAAVALLTALSYAELASFLPKEGGVYEFGGRLISPFAGFLSGWMWIVSNAFTGAAVSLAFAYYLSSLFPSSYAHFFAAAVCIAFTALNYFGVRQSAILNNFLVGAKLLVLAFFLILGATKVDPANLSLFVPSSAGVLYGAFYIFFAFGGFARVTVVAEEVKEAERNVPRAILLSLGISTVVYVLVGIVAVGLVGAAGLAASNSPLATAIGATGSSLAVYIVSAGGLLATASVLLTTILGVSRVSYAMARKADLPSRLGRLHPKYSTPYISVWLVGGAMALLVLLIDLTSVVAVSIFAQLFYYSIANLSALKMKGPGRRYPSIVPVAGLLSCLILLIFSLLVSWQSWAMGVSVLLAGALYYGLKNNKK